MKIFSIVLILIFMAEPLWGNLAKSAVDAEKVEEAITRLIAVHEAAETSHLGVGESLETHKSSDVIDHLAGSVIADKFSNRDFVFNLPFESLDKYNVSTGVDADIGGVRVTTPATTGAVRYLNAVAQYSQTYFKISRNSTFQFFAHLTYQTNQVAYVLIGGGDGIADPPGVGFKFINSSLYACEEVFGADTFDEYTSAITGINTAVEHIYRVQLVPADNAAYFYVDGVLKATLYLHVSVDYGLSLFTVSISPTANEAKNIWVHGVYISMDSAA